MAVSTKNIREIRKLHVEAYRDYTKTVIIYLNQRKLLAKARGMKTNLYEEKIEEAMDCYHKGIARIKNNLEILEAKVKADEIPMQLTLQRDAIQNLQGDTTKLQYKMSNNNYMATRRSRPEFAPPTDVKVNIWNDSLNETQRLEQQASIENSNLRYKRVSHLPLTTSRCFAYEFIYAIQSKSFFNLKETELEICKYILADN